ncbi:MAG: hypothetical protein PHC92_05710 [Syntrophomonadaceae bacterium]|nr:hypothetical protein [Syntrophomonadaceae bacterium]MDD3024693.1 hypothetical protein [Syntrophomonadaceae bacterium]
MNNKRESIENENEGIKSKKRNKNSNQNTNTIIDIVMFLVMLAIFCVEGELHESLGYMMGGLTIVHIALHWRQFKVMYCRLIPEVRYQRLAALFTAILVIAILTMPLYMNVGDSGMGDHGRDGDFGPTGRYHSEGKHH